ncbi:hypothetical protein GCM10017687_14290 [Streptomyces echinatus]|uniref:serine hydrolase n=1 Tax=Streptomyces echinatus TaxID=67293 RepID=UPI00338219A5
MRTDTVFGRASLTKILAVWSSIGALWEHGTLDLDQAAWQLLAGGHRTRTRIRHAARQLLTHTAGVPLRAQLKNLYGTNPDDIRRGVLHEPLHRSPGEAVEYTDPGRPHPRLPRRTPLRPALGPTGHRPHLLTPWA